MVLSQQIDDLTVQSAQRMFTEFQFQIVCPQNPILSSFISKYIDNTRTKRQILWQLELVQPFLMYTRIVGKVDAFACSLFREFAALPTEIEIWKFAAEIVMH